MTDTRAEVSRFRTKEEVQNELDTICLTTLAANSSKSLTHDCKHVEDPPIVDPLCDEAKDERRNRYANCDHESPNTQEPCSISLEEGFRNNSGSNCSSRTNEPGNNSSTQTHRRVGMTVGASNIADKTANEGEQEYGSSSEPIGQRSPEERSTTKDSSLQRGKLCRTLQTDMEVDGDTFESRLDRSSGESCHHRME